MLTKFKLSRKISENKVGTGYNSKGQDKKKKNVVGNENQEMTEISNECPYLLGATKIDILSNKL